MKNFSGSKLAGLVLTQRKLLGLTQQELADRAGINRSMLCRLENQDYIGKEDSEDIYYSEKTLAEIKSGKQKTYPAEEVYKKLRL